VCGCVFVYTCVNTDMCVSTSLVCMGVDRKNHLFVCSFGRVARISTISFIYLSNICVNQ
jgi:hypothetical protein